MLQELRIRFNQYIESEGVSQKHIAKQIKIHESHLSRFKNGKIDLDSIDAETLDTYLISKGY